MVVSLPSDQSRSGSEGAATTPHGNGLALGSAPRRLTTVPIAPRNNADAAAFRGTMRKFVAGMLQPSRYSPFYPAAPMPLPDERSVARASIDPSERWNEIPLG